VKVKFRGENESAAKKNRGKVVWTWGKAEKRRGGEVLKNQDLRKKNWYYGGCRNLGRPREILRGAATAQQMQGGWNPSGM